MLFAYKIIKFNMSNKGVFLVTREQSEQANRWGAIERSERCDWTEWTVRLDERSERLGGPLKRNRLCIETTGSSITVDLF